MRKKKHAPTHNGSMCAGLTRKSGKVNRVYPCVHAVLGGTSGGYGIRGILVFQRKDGIMKGYWIDIVIVIGCLAIGYLMGPIVFDTVLAGVEIVR